MGADRLAYRIIGWQITLCNNTQKIIYKMMQIYLLKQLMIFLNVQVDLSCHADAWMNALWLPAQAHASP